MGRLNGRTTAEFVDAVLDGAEMVSATYDERRDASYDEEGAATHGTLTIQVRREVPYALRRKAG